MLRPRTRFSGTITPLFVLLNESYKSFANLNPVGAWECLLLGISSPAKATTKLEVSQLALKMGFHQGAKAFGRAPGPNLTA